MSILRTAHAEYRVTDLNAAKHFYSDVLGMQVIEQDKDRVYLGCMEERDLYSFVLRKAATPGVSNLCFRVESEKDLDDLCDLAEREHLKYKWQNPGDELGLGRAIRIQDPSGMPMKFVHKIERRPWLLQKFELYRGASIMRIDHFNCQVRDVRKAYNFYTKNLGFHCSEYTAANELISPLSKGGQRGVDSAQGGHGGAYEKLEGDDVWKLIETDQIWAAWLHRKQNVHDVAFMNGIGPRLHHVGFWAYDRVTILDCCDRLASMGFAHSIERGPGRHGLSNAFFLYLRDQDNNRIEVYTGDYLIADWDMPPVRWSINDPRRATFWGHIPPKSWFEEASLVEDILTGDLLPTTPPLLTDRPSFVI